MKFKKGNYITKIRETDIYDQDFGEIFEVVQILPEQKFYKLLRLRDKIEFKWTEFYTNTFYMLDTNYTKKKKLQGLRHGKV